MKVLEINQVKDVNGGNHSADQFSQYSGGGGAYSGGEPYKAPECVEVAVKTAVVNTVLTRNVKVGAVSGAGAGLVCLWMQ